MNHDTNKKEREYGVFASINIIQDNNIKANAQDGKIIYIITEQMRNVRREKLKEKIGELSEEDHQKVKNRIAELMK